MKQYEWLCQACGNENEANLDICSKCRCPAVVSAEDLARYKLGKRIRDSNVDFDGPLFEFLGRNENKRYVVAVYLISAAATLLASSHAWQEKLGWLISSALGFHIVYAFAFGGVMHLSGKSLNPGIDKGARIFCFPLGIFILWLSFSRLLGA